MIVREVRVVLAVSSVTASYRAGDYVSALQKTERLKDGESKTPEYCFFRGAMLHKLGQLSEAENNLREGLLLESDSRRKGLVYNTLAEVLMDQERFTEVDRILLKCRASLARQRVKPTRHRGGLATART